MKLYNILLIIDRRAIEGPLYAIELSIFPYRCIVAHHLPVVAADDGSSGSYGCVIDDGMVEGKHLVDLPRFSIEKMDSVAEGDLVVRVEVEECAMVREGAFLAICGYLFEDGVGTGQMLFR